MVLAIETDTKGSVSSNTPRIAWPNSWAATQRCTATGTGRHCGIAASRSSSEIGRIALLAVHHAFAQVGRTGGGRRAQRGALRGWRRRSHQGATAARFQPTYHRALTERRFCALHLHPHQPALLRAHRPHKRNLVLRTSFAGRTEELHQNQAAALCRIRAVVGLVGGARGKRTRLAHLGARRDRARRAGERHRHQLGPQEPQRAAEPGTPPARGVGSRDRGKGAADFGDYGGDKRPDRSRPIRSVRDIGASQPRSDTHTARGRILSLTIVLYHGLHSFVKNEEGAPNLIARENTDLVGLTRLEDITRQSRAQVDASAVHDLVYLFQMNPHNPCN